MVNNLLKDKNKAQIAVLVTVLLFVFILGLRFDFYFDLNDDSAIRDLLSGNYSGVPEAHCVQLLFPLGRILATMYQVCPPIPWFSLLLFGCQVGALAGCGYIFSKKGTSAAIISVLCAAVLFLREFVFIQYTVTAAMLCIFIMLDILEGSDHRGKGVKNCLIFCLAINLRSEMALLLLPFIGLAYLIAIRFKLKELFKGKVIAFFAGLILVTGLSVGIDSVAYSGQWKDFRQFFDARTIVYDYTGIPDYDSNIQFYQDSNISREQYELLCSYNFSLDEGIDVNLMKTLAEYAGKNRMGSTGSRLYMAVYRYIYDIAHGQLLEYYLILLGTYLFLLKTGIDKKNILLLSETVALAVLRSILWVFLLYIDRVGGLPERISHPLLIAEIAIALCLLSRDFQEAKWKKSYTFSIITMYACMILLVSTLKVSSITEEYDRKEAVNNGYKLLIEDLNSRDTFTYLDVYSMVGYSEKLFDKKQNLYRNYDLAGGWISKSPAFYAKAKMAGFNNPQEGIGQGKAVFFDKEAIQECMK